MPVEIQVATSETLLGVHCHYNHPEKSHKDQHFTQVHPTRRVLEKSLVHMDICPGNHLEEFSE
jgi:hypothetical protein